MPVTTGCTILKIQTYHDPNEGRTIINDNFDCLQSIIDSGLSGISSAATVVLAGTNIDVSGPGGGLPTYTVSLEDDVVINSLSATTLSGNTLFSGSTDLETIIRNISDEADITRVQPGTNINTGGTANFPIVNLNDNIAIAGDFSGGTGGGVIYSGGTDLYNIFLTSSNLLAYNGLHRSGNLIGLGGQLSGDTHIDNNGNLFSSNEFSASTISANTIHVDSLSGFSPINIGADLYFGNGFNLSAGTGTGVIYSGGTDLYDIFATGSGTQDLQSVLDQGSTGSISGNTLISSSAGRVQITRTEAFVGSAVIKVDNTSNLLYLLNASDTTTAETFITGTTTDWKIAAKTSSGDFSMIEYNSLASGSGLTITDEINNRGIVYDANYHANYENRSLIDLEYLTNYVSSSTTSPSYVLNNFIPLTGTSINVSGAIEFDDDIEIQWNGGSDTITYGSGSGNLEINTSTGVDFESGAIFSAGTDLYDIFVTQAGTSGDFLSISGGTVTGDTIFTQGVSADTITVTTTTMAPLNLPVLPTSFTSATHGDVWISADSVTGETLFNMVISGITKSVEITN